MLALFCMGATTSRAESDKGFVSLFDGESLNGWNYFGNTGGEYFVQDGVLVCPEKSKGNLLTDKEYGDFVLRLEYKLEHNGNNGVAIRAPLAGAGLTYVAVEIQMLDDDAPMHWYIRPWQHNGSVYGIVPAKNGKAKIGEWNTEEITCQGRHYKIVLNGRTIVNADLNRIDDQDVLHTHPGFLRESGHLGFLGHSSLVKFRNIRIKELPTETGDNQPPEGFKALFQWQRFERLEERAGQRPADEGKDVARRTGQSAGQGG